MPKSIEDIHGWYDVHCPFAECRKIREEKNWGYATIVVYFNHGKPTKIWRWYVKRLIL